MFIDASILPRPRGKAQIAISLLKLEPCKLTVTVDLVTMSLEAVSNLLHRYNQMVSQCESALSAAFGSPEGRGGLFT